jgi:ArsR family transcriptional regulator
MIRDMSNLEIDVEQLAAKFKALSNPQRLRIFLRLATCCLPGCCASKPASIRRCVGDLGADLDLAASTVSHHLKELRLAGLMHVERHGKNIECWISQDSVRALAAFFGNAHASASDLPGTDGRGTCKRTSIAAAPEESRPVAAATHRGIVAPASRR